MSREIENEVTRPPEPLTTELAQHLRKVLDAAMELLESDKGTIHLGGTGDKALALAIGLGFPDGFTDPLGSADAGRAIWRLAFDRRRRVVVEDVTADPIGADAREVCALHGVRSLQAAPLFASDGQPFGLLSLFRAGPHRPSERELRLLELFSRQAEQVIECRRTFEALGRNEAGLRLALDAGEMGSWEWNIRTGEVRWSANLEPIHGLPPGSFGGTFDAYLAIIHPDDREDVQRAVGRSIESGADYETEFRSLEPEGGERWMMGKGKVLTDEQGRPSRMIGVCMDITRRKRAEEAILQADRRKDEFLAMISHELRNPLAAIMNASTLLERVSHDAVASSNARVVIRRQTEQLTRIVDDLLDVSRLSAGKLRLVRMPLDLAVLVGSCLKELAARHMLDHHRHEARLSHAPVHGDAARLEQVVTNLLTNAIKYTPAGGTIAVEVASDGDEAVLRVKDTGIGVPPELLPRIFELFVQSRRGLDRRDGGIGVGLSIVRRLVDAHGGRVDAHSAGANRGTELVVRLPLVATPEARADDAQPEPGRAARRSVLVIDDNTDAREALAILLDLAGNDVHEARDGWSGLDLAGRVQLDAVIVDVGLPGIDGFEVARRLRAASPSLQLIALTGYGHPHHRRSGAEAGFDVYLVKPVALDTVLRALAKGEPAAPAFR